jgi:hypothetical protein
VASRAPSYPRREQIERQYAIARAMGLDPAGHEVKPDGTIRVFEVRTPANDGLEGLVERE